MAKCAMREEWAAVREKIASENKCRARYCIQEGREVWHLGRMGGSRETKGQKTDKKQKTKKHHTKKTPWDEPECSYVFDDGRLGLGLPGLEVGAEHVARGGLDGGEIEQRRLERVLRAAVDKGAPWGGGVGGG